MLGPYLSFSFGRATRRCRIDWNLETLRSLSYFASFPTHAFTASDTVIISVIGSIGEAMNPRSS